MDIILEHLRGRSGYNSRGEEIPDPRPTNLVVSVEAEMPLHEKVLRAVQSAEFNRRMDEQGIDSWDEANDFDVEDELPEFKSIHEEESGDVIAYEEGRRAGFIEEIPAEKVEKAKEIARKADELRKSSGSKVMDSKSEGAK